MLCKTFELWQARGALFFNHFYFVLSCLGPKITRLVHCPDSLHSWPTPDYILSATARLGVTKPDIKKRSRGSFTQCSAPLYLSSLSTLCSWPATLPGPVILSFFSPVVSPRSGQNHKYENLLQLKPPWASSLICIPSNKPDIWYILIFTYAPAVPSEKYSF